MKEYQAGKGFVECGKIAKWRHPRYPEGVFCDKHKKTVSQFFPKDWMIGN